MLKFLVGGAVRDEIMGKTPKDFDYVVVMTNGDHCDLAEMNRGPNNTKLIGPEIDFFTFMVHKLRKEGFRTFVITPEHFTVRAQFPKSSGQRLTADFVLARKEGPYSDGRHPDWVEPGSLRDDLSRRDFTMNAIAKDENGRFHDPFDGQEDIEDHIIRAVGNAKDRLMEDALRALRAIRFSVQLGFGFHAELLDALHDVDVFYALRDNIADERKMDELNKMFKIDAVSSILTLNRFNKLMVAAFDGKVNLEATMKQKGFK